MGSVMAGPYTDIVVGLSGTGISRTGFGIPVKNAIDDLHNRAAALEGAVFGAIIKPSDTSRASTTTLTADPHLLANLQANGVYFVEMYLMVAGVSAADFQTTWYAPTGASVLRGVFGASPLATDELNAQASNVRTGIHGGTTAIGYGMLRNANNLHTSILEWAVVHMGATDGPVGLNWAQLTSNATATIVRADSLMRVTKFA